MLKQLKSIHGQGLIVQYAATFFLVVGLVTAMAVLARRAVQARILGAQAYSLAEVKRETYVGNVWAQYEPYYMNASTLRSTSQQIVKEVVPGGREGVLEYELPPQKNVSRFLTEKEQLSPEHAD